jgi:hypothetical protein
VLIFECLLQSKLICSLEIFVFLFLSHHKTRKPTNQYLSLLLSILVATAEDSDSPVAMKLKKMWLKTPVSEEQAAQAVLDPAIGNYETISIHIHIAVDEAFE